MKSEHWLHLTEAAKQIGVAPITLKRWLLDGKVPEVGRDRNNWRVFSTTDIQKIKEFASSMQKPRSK
tara:strand:- start:1264 stop:1464 length:201 start_codon:yes stop_codon:yes gene_type:complete